MNVPWWLLAVVGLLALLGLFLRGLAGRVDRINLRVEAARDALDAQLVRRAAVVTELAASGLLDPASAVLLGEAAHESQSAPEGAREAAESSLSQDLRLVLDDAGGAEVLADDSVGRELLVDLRQACDRAVLARRFYNDAVRASLELRHRPLVRTLHLYGHSHAPASIELDDAPPVALSGSAGSGT
ncbi:MAG: hypothetical protein WAN48_15880 [Actinomycetes bacterium]